MRVDLISTGDEILYGEIVDTNTSLAAALLADHGLVIGRHHTCGDDRHHLAATIKLALQEADAVICCGGLGPTRDDRTLEAVAAVLGVELKTDAGLLVQLEEKFGIIGVPLTENQKRQARLPQGARSISNPKGTAPGIEVHSGQSLLFCLPGPPAEYRTMLQEAVLPRLLLEKSRAGAEDATAVRTLRLFGRGEGFVEEALGRIEDRILGLAVGFRAANPEIHVKLRATGATVAEAEATLDAAEKLAREKLGGLIFATGDRPFAAAVLDLLRERGMTLAAAESCTGGMLGKLLTDVPGASAVFKLSAVTYSNDMKERVLKVSRQILERHGAVSAECARAMSEGVRAISAADLAVAVTGIAGPDGGSTEKPVGTIFFAVSDNQGTVAKKRFFTGGDRGFIRRLSAYTALYLARRRIQGDLK